MRKEQTKCSQKNDAVAEETVTGSGSGVKKKRQNEDNKILSQKCDQKKLWHYSRYKNCKMSTALRNNITGGPQAAHGYIIQSMHVVLFTLTKHAYIWEIHEAKTLGSFHIIIFGSIVFCLSLQQSCCTAALGSTDVAFGTKSTEIHLTARCLMHEADAMQRGCMWINRDRWGIEQPTSVSQ